MSSDPAGPCPAPAGVECSVTIRSWKLAVLVICACAPSLPLAHAQTAPGNSAQAQAARVAQRRQRMGALMAQRALIRALIRAPQALANASAQNTALPRKPLAEDSTGAATAPWTSVGPQQVMTPAFGLVTGRVTSIAADPSDPTGNTIYVGATGGGVWKSTNAAGPAASVTFLTNTDTLPAYSRRDNASLSIGALSVQPGGTGVVLAGTGDPNDALDSYYGSGILRSADGGSTWSLIDSSAGGFQRSYSFVGEAFAGFAWGTVGSQPVAVAAVTDSIEGDLVNAPNASDTAAGLYYSTDAGASWFMATIEDGPYDIIQSGTYYAPAGGSPATSVVWNPVRQRFYAAIRYHGYYESLDGQTWTRLVHQPGVNLTQQMCPTNPGQSASTACPIYRGTIAVQPATGDLFALTVDFNNQDQGLWRDPCSLTGGQCASPTVNFSQQIDSTPFEAGPGDPTIPQGDYNLTLAAVPSQQDTLLFVGTDDVYRCSLANSCAWRNTTNVNTCAAARVAESNHAIDATFGPGTSQYPAGLMYFGNDGGLWRSTDDVAQQQQSCQPADAAHYQNLNSGLGSLAEINSFSVSPTDPGTILAGLGALGSAAPQAGQQAWAQVLTGNGSETAIDPANPQNWYAPSGPGVAINLCADGALCTPAGFGLQPAIGDPQTANDGDLLPLPATWILDPQNTANMIVGTCRVWRGPANGSGWTASNLLSGMLDGDNGPVCNGNSQIHSLAASGSASDAPGTPEYIYAGMAGAFEGGGLTPGHLYRAAVTNPQGARANWIDISKSPVTNDKPNGERFNIGGFDISSIYVDPHDPTGNTVYVTIDGFDQNGIHAPVVYGSTDAGAHWLILMNNLPISPAHSIVVDPNDANTVYIALDLGVYVTRSIGSCSDPTQNCWTALGTGLPESPVIQLRTFSQGTTALLQAGTYGRGIWQIPMLATGSTETSATIAPLSLAFTAQPLQTTSASQAVTVTNTGALPLSVSQVAATGDFAEQDSCTQQPIAAGAACTVQVTFAPTVLGPRQGQLSVYANIPSGQITTSLSGTAVAGPAVVLLPSALNFGMVLNGGKSAVRYVTISNTGGVNINLQIPFATGDFQITANTCGPLLPPNTGCTVGVVFTPTASGARSGVLSIKDDAGTQTAVLSGTGQAPATDIFSAQSLVFPTLAIGQVSAPQQVTITNSGGQALNIYSVPPPTGDFTAFDNCPNPLPGGASCAITVRYVPARVGAETGSLVVADAFRTQVISLSGTGVAPAGVASATPLQVDFGSIGTQSSASQAVTLTNNGTAPLTGLTYNVTGGFILKNTCGASLDTGSSCQIGVQFAPSQTGPQAGMLTVSGANLPAPLHVALSGIGEHFALSVIGNANAVLVSGQTASYQVQVSQDQGSSGLIQFSCAGFPPNSTCTVNPSQLQVNSGTTGFLQITVATGVAKAANRPPNPFGKLGLALASMLPFLFLRRKYRRVWMVLFAAVALALLPTACGVAASGGSSAPPPSNQGGSSAPGTYTISVTGTVPGLQVSVPMSLIVQ